MVSCKKCRQIRKLGFVVCVFFSQFVNALELVNLKSYSEFDLTPSMVTEALKQSAMQADGDVQQLAQALTIFYRQQGLSFHQVSYRGGALRLTEGVLNSVSINEASWRAEIEEILSPLVGKVIYEPRMQEYLLKIRRLPGIELFNFYSVADGSGGMHLNVVVKNKYRTRYAISHNNYGLDATGQQQTSLSMSLFNFWLKPSRFSFSYSQNNAAKTNDH